MELGGESIATGHYAQIDEQNNCYRLLQAEDGTKDQSYFLYRLSQKQLAKAVFPLGKIYKREEIADLINLDKERSIDVIVTRLRKKIEESPKNPKYLQTIRGEGYVLWIE